MHEVSIAASILEIAERSARQHGECSIQKVQLRLGEFTGVVREALEFAFDTLKIGTVANEAALEIESVPLIASCPDCGWRGTPERDFCFICPACRAPVAIISGREMEVAYIEIERSEEEASLHGTIASRDKGPTEERRLRASQPQLA
jgi:hydrogenase nickel incorporation protein HypA/HybF